MRGVSALVAALMLLAGCSGPRDRGGFGDPPPPAQGAGPSPVDPPRSRPVQEVRVTAPGGFRFEPQTLELRGGRLTRFTLANRDSQEHTLVIGELAVVMLAGGGQEVRSLVEVDRGNTGRFEYFCSIEDHRERGMTGMVTVT